jgi:hypothetical protein
MIEDSLLPYVLQPEEGFEYSAEYGYSGDAVRFYRMAAEQGHSGALLRLKRWHI